MKNTVPSKNLLVVERHDGETVSYNPALLERQTAQSTVYRSEEREINSGERIQFSKAAPEMRRQHGCPTRFRKGHRSQPRAGQACRLRIRRRPRQTFKVDRVIISGDRNVSRQKEVLSHLSPGLASVSVHTPATAANRTEPDAPK